MRLPEDDVHVVGLAHGDGLEVHLEDMPFLLRVHMDACALSELVLD
jgi:hypothetical protein